MTPANPARLEPRATKIKTLSRVEMPTAAIGMGRGDGAATAGLATDDAGAAAGRATAAAGAPAAGGVGGAGAREADAAGAAAAGAAADADGGAPGLSVGNLIVGAEVGLGGKLMRTVSFFG